MPTVQIVSLHQNVSEKCLDLAPFPEYVLTLQKYFNFSKKCPTFIMPLSSGYTVSSNLEYVLTFLKYPNTSNHMQK